MPLMQPSCFVCAGGDGSLEWYKTKLSLCKVMGRAADRRTITGLKTKVTNLNEKQDPDAYMWKNFLAVVNEAEKFHASSLYTLSDEQLKHAIDVMQREKATFHPTVAYDLVVMRSKIIMEKKNWKELLEIINPWSQTEGADFDPKNPTLQTCAETVQKKLDLFDELIFSGLLCPLLDMGAEGCVEVVSFSAMCLELIMSVDILDTGAIHLDECGVTFRAVHALGTTVLDGIYQAQQHDLHHVCPRDAQGLSMSD
eukprot:6490779-Amphidinium_carterae.4